MKAVKELIAPVIMAGAFIFLSAAMAYSGVSWLSTFCFYFHLIPFGIGFAGGGGVIILIYYLALWVALTLFFLVVNRLFALIFKRRA